MALQRGTEEHWALAVRLDLLRAFFGAHGGALLGHTLCDLRFREWVRASAAPYPTINPSKSRGDVEGWLYFYDGGADAHAHAHNAAHPADRALAEKTGTRVEYAPWREASLPRARARVRPHASDPRA